MGRRVEKYVRGHGDRDSLLRGKRTTVNVLRELLLYLQIAKTRCIRDYAAGNEAKAELRELYSLEWESFEADFGGRCRRLVDELLLACDEEASPPLHASGSSSQ